MNLASATKLHRNPGLMTIRIDIQNGATQNGIY